MISKNRISLFVATFLIIGFFFLALPEKGYSGINGNSRLGCCLISPGNICTGCGSQDANSSEFQINDLTVAGQPQDTGLIILLADDEIDPDITGLFAIPLDPDLANIITAIIEEDLFVATGDVVRVDNGSVIQINDLNIAGEPQGDDLEGECDSVVDIDTSSTETLRNVILDMKTRGVLKEDGLGD